MPKRPHYPFLLILPTEEDTNEKQKTISFKQPIDPADSNSIKLTHSTKVYDSTYIEEILKHELQFAKLYFKINLDTIIERKAEYEATLCPLLQTTRR